MNIWGVREDPETRLAVVPVGYFWRVKAPAWGLSYYELQLRRKTRFGSKVVGDHPICRVGVEELTEDKVRDAAAYMMRHDRDVLTHFGKAKGVNHALLGDYPPRRISVDASEESDV